MHLTLENLQALLTDLTLFIHFFLGAAVLLIILLAAHAFPFYHDYSLLSTARSCARYLSISTFPLRRGVWADDDPTICKALLSPGASSDPVCLCEDAASAGAGAAAAASGPLVSGLVNTGNSCYINSVLQVLSSLPRLQLYLDQQLHQETPSRRAPVTFSLAKTLRLLARPLSKRSTFRPKELVAAMNNRRISGHDQQDAQELFQLITSALDVESQQRARTAAGGSGLKDVLLLGSGSSNSSGGRRRLRSWEHNERRLENPFTGLLANRLSCMQCGYTEAIRHFSFNNVQLVLPDTYATTLETCLREFTAMEYLSDATCRKCALIDAVSDMAVQVEALQEQARQRTADKAERRRLLTEMVRMDKRRRELEQRLSAGQIEQDDDTLRRVSRMSCKQAMFAKLPKVLCLHLSRSTFHPSGAVLKNGCRITFPETLDLQAYCTNGTLNTQPHLPISNDDDDSSSSNNNSSSNTRYRLMGVVVHYGSHDFGHFIAYKRRLVTDTCNCSACQSDWSMHGDDSTWFRISDEQVDTCSVDEALQSNPYMLLYEQIEPTPSRPLPAPSHLPLGCSAIHHTSRRAPAVAIDNSSSTTTTTTSNPPLPSPSSAQPPPPPPAAVPFYGSCLTHHDERWSETAADRRQSAPIIRV